jgi:RHS repeat-associated protein
LVLPGLFLAVLLLAPGVATSAGPTNVSGTIGANTTWTLADSPYVMTGDVTVASGVTLTVEPGVTVKGDAQSRKLSVNGSLVAEGTSGAPITFTSTTNTAPAQWNSITFGSGSGTSSLKHVVVKYGGGTGVSDTNGMVVVNGGTVTIEDATITESSVSGIKIDGGSAGTAATLTLRRTKVEKNGFVGANRYGDGMYVFNARVVVEDSAFWSNALDGLEFGLLSGYAASSSAISGTSIWDNRNRAIYVNQGSSGQAASAPDGNVAGEPGNAIYDNGSYGLSYGESWQQLRLSFSSGSVDWSNTFWGAVTYQPCSLGSQRGHLSYSVPDSDHSAWSPVPRGPVSRTTSGSWPNPWCGNDDVVVSPHTPTQPDLYFDAPPPIFRGLTLEQMYGTSCECVQIANAGDLAEIPHTHRPVNTASGSLTESTVDVQMNGPGPPFAWRRSYNSRDTSSGALGVGWSHPYEAKLTVINGNGDLEYRSGSGQRSIFTKLNGSGSGDAKYAATGFDGQLNRLWDNSYQLMTRDRRVYNFDSSGRLTWFRPRFRANNSLAYTSGKLSSITDGGGRVVTITYSSANPSLIERVTLPDSRYIEYSYTNARLTSVRDPRGKVWTLTYTGAGLLQSIQDPDGRYELQNVVYDGQGRVTSEQDGAGETITYAYTTSDPWEITTVGIPGRGSWVYKHRKHLLHSVTDPLSRTTTYTYDGYARKVTATDPRGFTTRFEYDERGNVLKEIAPAIPVSYTIERTYNSTNDLLTEKDRRGNTTTYSYASSDSADYQAGQLATITDREGAVTTLKYLTPTSTPPSTGVTRGLLKNSNNARGKTTSFAYDTQGNLLQITSPLGLKTTMSYDGSGRLTSRRDPRGNAVTPAAGYLTQWSYDNADHVTSITDALGNVTTNDYYDNGLLWKTTRTDRGSTPRVTTVEYDADNRLWKTTDPRNGVETRLYWPDGKLKSVETGAGRKTSYEYDNAGQLWKLVEPNGNAAGATAYDYTWTYGYDDAGNRTSEAHPDGGTRTIVYDPLNRPYEWEDALEHLSSVIYDGNGNVLSRTNPEEETRQYSYDKLDRVLTETDERNNVTTHAYWATGELKSTTTDLGHKTSWTLDDDGRLNAMVEARGNASGANPADYTWAYQYDGAGNRTRVTDPLGNYVQYAYDAVNNLTQVTDQRGNGTDYSYDVLNRLWKVTPPAAGGSGTLYTEYAYDGNGNLASRTDPNGHTTSWTHDLDGRLTARTTGVGTWNYSYDANGNLKTLETPAGSSTPGINGDGTITYGHDRMSRQTSVDHSDATPDITRTYDLAGRPATMVDGAGTLDYTHDDADRLTDIARSGGGAGLNGTLSYDYDDAGNITGRELPDGTTATNGYDDDGRLTSITAASATSTLAYDPAGNLTTITLPSGNGHVETRTYDRAGRLSTVENTKNPTILSNHLWTLDGAGNPTKVKTTRGTTDVYDVYEYDTRNRLTAACYDVASSATNCTGATNSITYAYDKVTNRTQEVRTGSVGNTGTIDYTYNAADQLTSTTKGGSSTTYTYDTNGNQASIGGRTFTYNLAGQLASTSSGGVTSTYGYDGDGRRTSSTSGGGGADLRYVWDALAPSGMPELTLERDPSGNLVRRYLTGPSGGINYATSGGTFWYHHDPLNTATDVTDASGAAQWKYEYEPYGAQRTATNVSGTAPENRLRFTGQYLDSETTNYHLRARQYDPSSGRFGALDPVENPATAPFDSAYAYVNGRPLHLVDPLGLRGYGWDDFKRDAGGVVDGGRDFLTGGARTLGNGAAGLADGGTGGLSTLALNAGGIHPDTNSTSFRVGQAGGTALAVGTGTGLAVKAGGRLVVGAARGRAGAAFIGGSVTDTTLLIIRGAIDGQLPTGWQIVNGLILNAAGGVVGRCLRPLTPGRSLGVTDDAAKGVDDAAKALGPGTSFGTKIERQLPNRGWTKRLVQSTIDKPVRTVTTRDTRYLPGGARLDDPATAYYGPRGGYVVRNDRTGDIVQVSDRTDPAWTAPWD